MQRQAKTTICQSLPEKGHGVGGVSGAHVHFVDSTGIDTFLANLSPSNPLTVASYSTPAWRLLRSTLVLDHLFNIKFFFVSSPTIPYDIKYPFVLMERGVGFSNFSQDNLIVDEETLIDWKLEMVPRYAPN